MTPRPIPPKPMPRGARVALRSLTPDQAAKLLAEANDKLFKLVTGQLPNLVETPQLGRVQFQPTTAADLQLLIDYLNDIVTGGTGGRKPFSFEAWP